MLLEIDGLRSGYGRVAILHGVGLEVDRGEVLSVLGPNGAGKTTLMRAIAGHLPVSGGTVRFGGRPLGELSAREVSSLGIGYVPQERNVFGELTVLDNLRVASLHAPRGAEGVRDVLRRFPVLEERGGQLASTLSGGERQTLAIGSALIATPKLLLLDEPTAGLAPLFVNRIVEWVGELAADGMAVVWVVEQNPEKVLAASRTTCLMAGGRSTGQVESRTLLEPGRLQATIM